MLPFGRHNMQGLLLVTCCTLRDGEVQSCSLRGISQLWLWPQSVWRFLLYCFIQTRQCQTSQRQLCTSLSSLHFSSRGPDQSIPAAFWRTLSRSLQTSTGVTISSGIISKDTSRSVHNPGTKIRHSVRNSMHVYRRSPSSYAVSFFVCVTFLSFEDATLNVL